MNIENIRKIAQRATREALREACSNHEIPRTFWERLVLSEGDLDSRRMVFELHIPGVRPIDAVLISRAVVERDTALVTVEVLLENLLAQLNVEAPNTTARVLNGLISACKRDEMPRECSGEANADCFLDGRDARRVHSAAEKTPPGRAPENAPKISGRSAKGKGIDF